MKCMIIGENSEEPLSIQSFYKCYFYSESSKTRKGWVNQNNQSKSRLFLLLDKLKENFPVAYFPAYEILIDALRDYRFYKGLVHPNEQAIDFVWSHFVRTYYSDANTELLKELQSLKLQKVIKKLVVIQLKWKN